MKTQREQKGQKSKKGRKAKPKNELFLVKSVCIGTLNVNPADYWLKYAVRRTNRQMGIG